jgi:hypothetical protein
MSKLHRIDSVGWGFFAIVLVAAIPASVYFVFQITHDSLTLGTRAGSGITLAFFVTAFFTWTVNSLLQLRAGHGGESTGQDSED